MVVTCNQDAQTCRTLQSGSKDSNILVDLIKRQNLYKLLKSTTIL